MPVPNGGEVVPNDGEVVPLGQGTPRTRAGGLEPGIAKAVIAARFTLCYAGRLELELEPPWGRTRLRADTGRAGRQRGLGAAGSGRFRLASRGFSTSRLL